MLDQSALAEDVLQFEGLGTKWVITTPCGTLTAVLQTEILLLVRSFEAAYSRFIPSSFVGMLNDTKVIHQAPTELIAMLEHAITMHGLSWGVFNITIGGVLEQHGYGKMFDKNAAIALSVTDAIHIDGTTVTLSPLTRIDLGGIGKGWLIDSLHELLNRKGVVRHIINGGGDIRIGTAPEKIYIEDPRQDTPPLIGCVELAKTTAFAASSNSKRNWYSPGGSDSAGSQARAHILDPYTTNIPALTTQSCVLAADCTTADVAATVLLLLNDRSQRQEFAQKVDVEYALLSDSGVEQSAGFSLMKTRTGHEAASARSS